MPILAKKLNSTRIQTEGGQARWASPKERTGVDPGTTDEFGGGDRRMRVSMYSEIVVCMNRMIHSAFPSMPSIGLGVAASISVKTRILPISSANSTTSIALCITSNEPPRFRPPTTTSPPREKWAGCLTDSCQSSSLLLR